MAATMCTGTATFQPCRWSGKRATSRKISGVNTAHGSQSRRLGCRLPRHDVSFCAAMMNATRPQPRKESSQSRRRERSAMKKRTRRV